jgi:hypothetical protein
VIHVITVPKGDIIIRPSAFPPRHLRPLVAREMKKRSKRNIVERKKENLKWKMQTSKSSDLVQSKRGKSEDVTFRFQSITSPQLRDSTQKRLGNVKHGLQLDDQLPLVVADVIAVEILEAVDAGTRDLAEELIRLLELAAVRWLVAARFDLDGYRRLALLAYLDLLVLSLDRRPIP